METAQQNTYLLTEPVGKLLPKFAVPCVASLLISCLYNIVDQIFVGQGVGFLGNAATGIIFPFTFVGLGLGLMFGDGGAAFLSLSQGAGNTKDASKSVANSMLFSFGITAVFVGMCYVFGDRILYALGATEDTITLTRDYGRIIFGMMPVYAVGQTLVSIIRADGNPKYAMLSMLAGCVLNIILDPIAIFALGWGIKGAAYATIFGQFVTFVMTALYLRKSKTFRVKLGDFKPNFGVVRQIAALGGSSFLTEFSIVIVTVVNNNLLVKYGMRSEFGPNIPLAAFVVIMKLFQFVICFVVGIAAGAQPIIGYNFGAKRYDRVKETFKRVMLSSLIVTLIATALFEFLPRMCVSIFGAAEDAVYMRFSVACLRIYLSLIVLTCLQKACAIFLQSIGKAKAAIPLSILRDVVTLIGFSLVLPLFFGVKGIFWAAPAADILAAAITLPVIAVVLKGMGKSAVPGKVEIPKMQKSKPGVVITIDREHGSGGKIIGQLVAESLKIPFYYKEMIGLAAEESGLAKEFISGINAAEPGTFHQLYISSEPVQQAVIAQEKIIRKIAENGSCVIVGRAGGYVLRENSNAVHLFIHAPESYRVAQVMKTYGLAEPESRKSVARVDSARSAYYAKISGRKWGDPKQYHLCLDSSVGLEKTAKVILEYVNPA